MKRLFFLSLAIIMISTISFAQSSTNRITKPPSKYEVKQIKQKSSIESIEKEASLPAKTEEFDSETKLKIDEIVKSIVDKKKIISTNPKISNEEKIKLENEYDVLKEKMLIDLLGESGYKTYLMSNHK